MEYGPVCYRIMVMCVLAVQHTPFAWAHIKHTHLLAPTDDNKARTLFLVN